MLLSGQAAALPAEMTGERADHRIEHGYDENAETAAAILQRAAQRFIDQGEEDDAGIRLDAGDDAFDLRLGAHHRPDMLDRLGILELDEAGARDRMNGVARRVRNEMKMEARQSTTPCASMRRRLGIKQANRDGGEIHTRPRAPPAFPATLGTVLYRAGWSWNSCTDASSYPRLSRVSCHRSRPWNRQPFHHYPRLAHRSAQFAVRQSREKG